MNFIQNSGLKILSIARLTQVEYSVVLYLLHCSISGLDKIITRDEELADLLYLQAEDINAALDGLKKKSMIKIHYPDSKKSEKTSSAYTLSFITNIDKWKLPHAKDLGAKDAIIYPFRKNFSVLKTVSKNEKQNWEDVYDFFAAGKNLTEEEKIFNQEAAKLLLDSQSFDLIILIIGHFKDRIKSLHFLASSWFHYVELYEREAQKVSFSDAKKKHQECEESLRLSLKSWIAKREELNLTLEEVRLLNMIYKHKHPRRQLFWAFQEQSNYKNLKEFFVENESCMLPITTSGTIIKK